MKRVRYPCRRFTICGHPLLTLIAALFMIGGCATRPVAQSPIPDTNEEVPRTLQILQVEKGNKLSRIVSGETHDGLSCDSIQQVGMRYELQSYAEFGFLHIQCAHVRLGSTEAVPQHVRYVKRALIGTWDNVAIAPAETVLSRIWIDIPPILGRIHPGGSHLLLNGKKLIIQPDDDWSQKGSCEKLERALVGQRNDADLCADIIFTEEPQPATGSLILSHWKTNLTCTFAVPTGPMKRRHYHFLDWEGSHENQDDPWGPCSANTTNSIQLENVPSAVQILLTDDPGCDKDAERNEFWIELRTTAKSVTLNALPLDEILTYQPDAIVRPGLQLVNFNLVHGKSAQRNLGCVKVTTSAAPPTP